MAGKPNASRVSGRERAHKSKDEKLASRKRRPALQPNSASEKNLGQVATLSNLRLEEIWQESARFFRAGIRAICASRLARSRRRRGLGEMHGPAASPAAGR